MLETEGRFKVIINYFINDICVGRCIYYYTSTYRNLITTIIILGISYNS